MAYLPVANSTDQKGACKVCKKGYHLDKDGYCVQINVSNCTSF